MEQKKYFFAVDLGATSGRTIIGSLSDGKFNLEEMTRFDNNLIETGNHFYWDIYALYLEIIKGLKLVAQRGINIQSIGIDTWGCDFVYVGKDGAILRNPLAYRGISAHRHPVHELQLPLPDIRYAQGWQCGFGECKQNTLYSGCAELYAYR